MKNFKIVGLGMSIIILTLFLGVSNVYAAEFCYCGDLKTGLSETECNKYVDVAGEKKWCEWREAKATSQACFCDSVKNNLTFEECSQANLSGEHVSCQWKSFVDSSVSSGGSSGSSDTADSATAIAGDQRCWTKDTCIAYREKTYNFAPEEAAKGFYSAVEHSDAEKACGTMRGDQEMGFCSPDTVAETQIGFGSVKTFANFGVFIRYIYQYGFLVAGILAVVIIIFGGIEWMTSAGSQEKIKAGQKRIFDSVIGIAILSLSYVILNFINPYIVNFRLPQVWIINSSLLGIEFCHEIPDYDTKEMYKLVGSKSYESKPEEITAVYDAGLTTKYNEKDFACGKQYAYSSAPSKTIICRGSTCVGNQVCLALPEKGYTCVNGVLSGKINPNQNFFKVATGKGWEDDVVNDIDLYIVCSDGSHYQVNGGYDVFEDGGDKQAAYTVSAHPDFIKKAIENCGASGNTLGFVLYPDFNKNWSLSDQFHWLGKKPDVVGEKSNAVDLGTNYTDFFDKIKSGSSINYNGKDYPARDFLIPSEYFNGDKSGLFKLDIVAGDIPTL